MKILKIGLFDTLFFVGFFLYRILLDWCYFNIISPVFSYAGFHDNSSLEKLVLSWLLLFLFYIAILNIYQQENWRASTMITGHHFFCSVYNMCTRWHSFGRFDLSFLLILVIIISFAKNTVAYSYTKICKASHFQF